MRGDIGWSLVVLKLISAFIAISLGIALMAPVANHSLFRLMSHPEPATVMHSEVESEEVRTGGKTPRTKLIVTPIVRLALQDSSSHTVECNVVGLRQAFGDQVFESESEIRARLAELASKPVTAYVVRRGSGDITECRLVQPTFSGSALKGIFFGVFWLVIGLLLISDLIIKKAKVP